MPMPKDSMLEDLNRFAEQNNIDRYHFSSFEEMKPMIYDVLASEDAIVTVDISTEENKSAPIQVIIHGDGSSTRFKKEELLKLIADSSLVEIDTSPVLSITDNLERLAAELNNTQLERFIPDLPESKRDPHWYNQYDFKGKKKHRKYS